MMPVNTTLKLAILMTCYNRVEKTLKCLDSLHKASVPDNVKFDIYLVDDNSPDKTGKIVKNNYPDINVIPGTGYLYWNRGMRLAWKNARRQHDYDFYLLVNDDVFINTDAIKIIFSDYYSLLNDGIEAIVSGVCKCSNSLDVTYGGSNEEHKVIVPNGLPRLCKYTNCNFTLVSKKIFHKIGYLSYKYIHAAGDHDYGLRATKAGFKCYISSSVLAICDGHIEEQDWLSADFSLQKRLKNLFSIKGWDYFFFAIEDHGLFLAISHIVKGFLRAVFPTIIRKVK